MNYIIEVSMKKKDYKMVIYILVVVLLMTGCGKQESNFLTQKDVFKYLEREYKTESFEIVSQEEIKLSDERNCKGEYVDGNSYTVKSLKSNLIFTVKDLYYYNMIYCSPIKYDDYLNKAIEEYASNIDSRIEITYANRAYAVPTLNISLSDFEDEKEAIKIINDFSIDINKKAPFSDGNKYVNSRICKGSILSSTCNNITTIEAISADNIIELIKGLKGV